MECQGANFRKYEHLGAALTRRSSLSMLNRLMEPMMLRVEDLCCVALPKLNDCKSFGINKLGYGWMKFFPGGRCKAVNKHILQIQVLCDKLWRFGVNFG